MPVYARASELVRRGVTTGSTAPNRAAQQGRVSWLSPPPADLEPLLYDPQTAGGLLMAIPGAQADACVRALVDAGVPHARRIGEVVSADAPRLEVVL